MMFRRILLCAALLAAIPVRAQRPIVEPDDFVDPAMYDGLLFLSRAVLGGVANPSSHYRPHDENAGFVLITNSLYAGSFQFDYKHLELFGDDEAPSQRCDCPEPVYFPTAPPPRATPDAPPLGRSDTLQVAFYRISGPDSPSPATLRYRASFSRQQIATVVTSPATDSVVERHSGRDQSFTLDADTHLRLGSHELWGSLYFTQTSLTETPAADHSQNEVGYVSRPPGRAIGRVLLRPRFTIAHITGRGAPGLNVLNPYLEAVWRHEKTRVSVHLAWSGEWTKSSLEGWRPNHQIAVFVDRTLYVKSFGRTRD